MRNIKLKHKMLISCSNEIIEKSPLISKMKSITFYLAALAFPIDMKKFLKISLDKSKNAPNQVKHATEMIKIIECVMNNFSIKILNRFLEITEISILLVNYLSKVHNPEYEDYYVMLKEMADESIKKSKTNVDEQECSHCFLLIF